MSWYISVIGQTVRYWTPVFTQPFSCRPILLNLQLLIIYPSTTMISWRCHTNSVNTGSSLPNIQDVMTRKRRNVIGIDMFQNNRIATCSLAKQYEIFGCTKVIVWTAKESFYFNFLYFFEQDVLTFYLGW